MGPASPNLVGACREPDRTGWERDTKNRPGLKRSEVLFRVKQQSCFRQRFLRTVKFSQREFGRREIPLARFFVGEKQVQFFSRSMNQVYL